MCRVFLLHREQDFCNFCCKPSKIKFCIEEVSVGEIYNTLLDSNEGDLSPYTSQKIYFSKTNENKMSNKEAPVGEVVELESGIELLWIIFINIRRHSVLSSWFCPLWNISWRTNWNLSAPTSSVIPIALSPNDENLRRNGERFTIFVMHILLFLSFTYVAHMHQH